MSVFPAPNDSAALSFRSRPAAAGAGFVSVAVAVWNDLLRHVACYVHQQLRRLQNATVFLASRRRRTPAAGLSISRSPPLRARAACAVPLPVGAGPQ